MAPAECDSINFTNVSEICFTNRTINFVLSLQTDPCLSSHVNDFLFILLFFYSFVFKSNLVGISQLKQIAIEIVVQIKLISNTSGNEIAITVCKLMFVRQKTE